MRLSAIVITRNERANIADCLLSLGFADEVVVLRKTFPAALLWLLRRRG